MAVRDLERARSAAEAVTDPELPMLTLADLGVLRNVTEEQGRVVVSVTPTHLGCPAFATIQADLRLALARAGFEDVDVRTVLAPAWSTDWITERGRMALTEHGIAAPPPVGEPQALIPLVLLPGPPTSCPRCGSVAEELSSFGATPCTSLQRCPRCGEPFGAMKPL